MLILKLKTKIDVANYSYLDLSETQKQNHEGSTSKKNKFLQNYQL